MTIKLYQIVRQGNINNHQLPCNAIVDAIAGIKFGESREADGVGTNFEIVLGGNRLEPTDISSGHRGHFRRTGKSIREFYREHSVEVGDILVFEQVARFAFEVHVEDSSGASTSSRASEDEDTGRSRRLAKVLSRPEQAKFRKNVAARDGWKCAVTGCEERAVLEAAHLHPVAPKEIGEKGGSDKAGNGMLLRADIHRLFDADLITIDPSSGIVSLSPKVKAMDYKGLHGVKVSTGADLRNLEARYK